MKKGLILLAAGIMLTLGANAQKLGFINTENLVQAMPEYTKASTDLQAYTKTFADQAQSMQKDLEDKYAVYTSTSKTMTEAVKEVKEKEITSLQQRLQEYSGTADEKIGKKRGELMQPIITKVKAAIEKVAKDKALDYIFEEGSLLYSKPADDLAPAVKAQLGIK